MWRCGNKRWREKDREKAKNRVQLQQTYSKVKEVDKKRNEIFICYNRVFKN
jgi:hypothetical protein